MSAVVLTFTTATEKQTPQVVQIIDRDSETFVNDTHVGIKGSLQIQQGANETNPFERYITSSLTYSFRLTNSDLHTFYENLVSGEEGRYFIKYFLDGTLEWIGVILPDVGGVALDQNKPVLTIKAVDILADVKGRPLSAAITGITGQPPAIRQIAKALENSAIYDQVYQSTDPFICSAVPMYAAGMATVDNGGTDVDSMAQLAIQEYIWRKRDEIGDAYDYEDCDVLITDYLNVVNARIYQAKGRIVIENIYVRTADAAIKYFEYTRAEAEVAGVGILTSGTGTFEHTGFSKALYNVKSLGGANTIKARNDVPIHRHLPPARAIHLTKSGNAFRNLLRNRIISLTGQQTTVLSWNGSYGVERRLTSVNEITGNKFIIDVVVEAYVDGTSIAVGSMPSEYIIEVAWIIKCGNDTLTNKNGVITLTNQYESVAMMADLPWSGGGGTRLVYRNQSTIPVKGHVEQGVFDQKKKQSIRLISEELPEVGDLTFEIDEIKLYIPVSDTLATLPNGTTLYYSFDPVSKMGVGEEIESVYDENDKVTVKQLVSNKNKHIYEMETRLIDYSDNNNDPRALILPYKLPSLNVGLTDWTCNTLTTTDKIDEIILSQAISMTRNSPRIITVEASDNIDLANRYRHKYYLTNDYYICMPLRRTFYADREVTRMTVLVMRTDGAAGTLTTITTDKGLTGLAIDANTYQLLNSPDGGNFQNGGSDTYPLFFEADSHTGDELTVTGITLPDPTSIVADVRRKFIIVVGGIEYRLVSEISTDKRVATTQVTTITTGSDNKLKFGRALTGQFVSVRQLGAYDTGTTA
jgi:hypothetical protein